MLLCGNGGSGADCDHIVTELLKSFVLPRPLPLEEQTRIRQLEPTRGSAPESLPAVSLADRLQRGVAALSLTGPAALLTALQNDVAPEMVFAQQVYVLGRPGDVLLSLSTSGSSQNVLNALIVAKAFDLTTIGLTGRRPSPMEGLCDVLIQVPGVETFQVQELHLPVYHALCLMIECELFG